jgi:hypothetical protein
MKKKIIALFMSVAMGVSCFVCSGITVSATDESAEEVADNADITSSIEEVWSVQKEVDEFGDEIEGGAKYLVATTSGTFSNTATKDSELGVTIRIYPSSVKSLIYFSLDEYNDVKATYTSNDELSLKTKVGDEINNYVLYGEVPNDDLVLGIVGTPGKAMAVSEQGDEFLEQLLSGEDIRCIIGIGSSQYNFTVESANIVEACENSGEFEYPQPITGRADIVDAFGLKIQKTKRTKYLNEHIEEYPVLTDEEIQEVIAGNAYWLIMYNDNDFWKMCDYTDGIETMLGKFSLEDGTYEEAENPTKRNYTIEDGILSIDVQETGNTILYRFRKLGDGYYIAEEISEETNSVEEYLLFIQYDENYKVVYDYH